MKLYIANVNNVMPGYKDFLSPARAEKVNRLRQPADKKRSVAAGLMLRYFLNDAVITDNGFGKPITENGLCFNLSHSGDYAVLAVGSSPVGCDIEQLRIVKAEKLGKIVFTQNELARIFAAKDKTGVFFKLWTKKESLLKCMGKGFHRNAKSVDVSEDYFSENNLTYYMKTLMFSDYALSVCSVKPIAQLTTETVNLKTIVNQLKNNE